MADIKTNTSLKSKSVTAVLWSGIDLVMRQGLQFIVSVILARLLSPEEFGTVALLYLFTGIGNVFSDGGFSAALVQKQDITREDEYTVFWFNLGMSALIAILLCLISPLIADFYDLPVLTNLMRLLAFSVFISALGSIHHVLLTKNLNFKALMQASFVATLVSGLVVVAMAYYGYGVWALVLQALTTSAVTSGMLWLLSSWRPRMAFSAYSFRRLFRFGSYLMLSGLLDVTYNRFYSLLIGKIYSIYDLGIYNRADNTKQIPVDLLSGVLSRVSFPIFSAASQDQDRLRRGVKFALRGAMFVNIPMMLGLLVTADNVVPAVFGPQWTAAVPVLQVLCLAGVFWPLHVINLNVLISMGYTHLFFRLEILKKIIGTLCVLGGLYFGIMGLAWGQVVFGALAFLVNAYYTRRYLDYGPLRQIWDFTAVTVSAAIMMVFVYYFGKLNGMSQIMLLISQIALGVLLYSSLCVIFRIKALMGILDLLLHRLGV